MAKPKHIELAEADLIIPILYEDRSLIAVDKPAGWMLAPDSWDATSRNLQLALQSSLNAGDFWARSRNLKYLRFVHRLDAETTGVLLLAKSSGALAAYSELFETRQVEKEYLAVVHGTPQKNEWVCDLPIAPEPGKPGLMRVARGEVKSRDRLDENAARDAETRFKVLKSVGAQSLVYARPMTGRTHQIRVHLSAAGHPMVGDAVYGQDKAAASKGRQKLALRAWRLAFRDPFQNRRIFVQSPAESFLKEYGFDTGALPHSGKPATPKREPQAAKRALPDIKGGANPPS